MDKARIIKTSAWQTPVNRAGDDLHGIKQMISDRCREVAGMKNMDKSHKQMGQNEPHIYPI